ncbi:TetR/AcrR family transcriptional regulator [Staphylococcus caledonicus]|uniref:TetR/AcrR family transcriptional regulator n=1 Tax=Staphylococcus caledonicus TaxID=2741333 RepID=UPI0018E44C13|nr:TetR/AcrR family transcriptional regulator [Staphylococcus caledonicus]MBI5973282.1 TetR/AcrR family transcriptional regulator [Staphylococcus caledonicus]
MKQKAKYRIIKSLIDLLEEYPFESISIKMICANSNVNRSTFYDNYQDKYDLLAKLQNYHLTKYENLLNTFSLNFKSIKKDPDKVYQFFRIILKYIYRKQAFYHAIFITHPNKDLVHEYLNITRSYYVKVLGENKTTIKNKSFFITYTMSGQVGVILTWLRDSCKESPEEVANILLANTIKVQR